jgi:hypothetical protein
MNVDLAAPGRARRRLPHAGQDAVDFRFLGVMSAWSECSRLTWAASRCLPDTGQILPVLGA